MHKRRVKINWYNFGFYLIYAVLCSVHSAALKENGKWRTSTMIQHSTLSFKANLYPTKLISHIHIPRTACIGCKRRYPPSIRISQPKMHTKRHIYDEILLTTIFISAFMCVRSAFIAAPSIPESILRKNRRQKKMFFFFIDASPNIWLIPFALYASL